MSESTKDERDRMRGLIGHGINENGTAAKCLRDADRLAQAEALLREARTVISMAANDADEIRRIKSGPNAAAAMQRRDKAWAVEAKISGFWTGGEHD